jgi:hypothetical protein
LDKKELNWSLHNLLKREVTYKSLGEREEGRGEGMQRT